MTNEIAVREEDSWIAVVGPVGDLAAKIARTPFVPRAMAGNAPAVAAAILTGREMGLGPMASLRGIDVIEGKPSLTAPMLAARILAAGHRIEWKSATDQRATVRIERHDGLSEAEVTWTIADAQRAGLASKKVWQQYPRHMLQHRALTEAAGMACPDVALGLDVEVATDEIAHTTTVTVHRVDPATQGVEEPSAWIADAVIAKAPDEPTTVEAEIVAPAPPPPGVTKPQMRKIGALIGEAEKIGGEKLDRDQRRALIARMAGVDPEDLTSANDLTEAQASAAIDALDELVRAALEADEQQQPTLTGDLDE